MTDVDRRSVMSGVAAGLFIRVSSGASVGAAAPPFTLTTLDRRTVSSADLRGSVIVLNYWATWCAPCRVEMPMMDAYLRRHPGQDLKIFAIGSEDSVPPSELAPLAAAFVFPLVTKFSGRGYGDKGALPTNYVIDRGGIVRHAAAGAFDSASFDALIWPLLAVPKPPPTAAASPT
ncbi:MAG: TlpA family protein disulfide reductase [Caulobacterales bacterium]